MSTILTPGNDTFTGAAGNETVFGLDGSDTLSGGDGADLLLGDVPGNGNDSLSGGAANDTLFGGNGADTLDGGAGDDQIYGEPGGDLIQGGDGADTSFGGDGADTMNGGNGRDFFIGDAGSDSLGLGEEDDVGFGGADADSIAGGNGNDFLFGDAGADTLQGEAGNDRLHADGSDAIVAGGDGGFDALVPLAGITAIDLSNAANQNASGSGPTITGVEAVDGSIATGALSITGAVFNNLGNVLFGGDFNDTIGGSTLADIVRGDQGNDSLSGANGDDQLFGDTGTTSARGDLGNDTIAGGEGNDTLFQSEGVDSLLGGNGADIFSFKLNNPQQAGTPPTAGFSNVGDFTAADDMFLFDAAGLGTDAAGANFINNNSGAYVPGSPVETFFSGAGASAAGESVMVITDQDFTAGQLAANLVQGEQAGDLIIYFNTTVAVGSMLYVSAPDTVVSIARFTDVASLADLQNKNFTADDFGFI